MRLIGYPVCIFVVSYDEFILLLLMYGMGVCLQKMLHGKLCPDGLERLRKLHSAQSLDYEKRQARLELLMAKVKKSVDSVSSSPEYSSSTGASMFVTLQECTDAICEVAKEEFSSMAPFSIAFLSEFDLTDLSVLTYVST